MLFWITIDESIVFILAFSYYMQSAETEKKRNLVRQLLSGVLV